MSQNCVRNLSATLPTTRSELHYFTLPCTYSQRSWSFFTFGALNNLSKFVITFYLFLFMQLIRAALLKSAVSSKICLPHAKYVFALLLFWFLLDQWDCTWVGCFKGLLNLDCHSEEAFLKGYPETCLDSYQRLKLHKWLSTLLLRSRVQQSH